MLDALNKDLSTKAFIGANTNIMHLEFITNPKAYGTYTTIFLSPRTSWPINVLS